MAGESACNIPHLGGEALCPALGPREDERGQMNLRQVRFLPGFLPRLKIRSLRDGNLSRGRERVIRVSQSIFVSRWSTLPPPQCKLIRR